MDIRALARDLGFDDAAVVAVTDPPHADQYLEWLRQGYAGDMNYLINHLDVRCHPSLLAPQATSLIMVRSSYAPGGALAHWTSPDRGRFARYCWQPDYHATLKERLFELDSRLEGELGAAPGLRGKACVDTAPLMERDFAALAGLGFIGRNTCLITPGAGSWSFLAGLLTTRDLPASLPPPARPLATRHPNTLAWELRTGLGTCGGCQRCITACPTHAFTTPYTLDARRCISYLTIEQRGAIPRDLRSATGNWVFGCDICQEVCPYNRTVDARLPEYGSIDRTPVRPIGDRQPDLAPHLAELLTLTDEEFRFRFRGSAVKRTKRDGLVRNACVAAGNSNDRSLAPLLVALLSDQAPLVRGHAAWALGKLAASGTAAALVARREIEPDESVRAELALALDGWTA
jgi:epoxyqueuosine reductase